MTSRVETLAPAAGLRAATLIFRTHLHLNRDSVLTGASIFVFGTFRTALFVGPYAAGNVPPVPLPTMISYSWLVECVYLLVFVPWGNRMATRIRSGEIVLDAVRPQSLVAWYVLTDCSRNLARLLTCCLPVPAAALGLLAIGRWVPVALPVSLSSWLGFLLSLILVLPVSALIRFLLESIAFWTADFRSYGQLIMFPLQLIGGFIIPVQFFGGVSSQLVQYSPPYALLTAPLDTLTGADFARPIVTQLVWIVILFCAGRLTLKIAAVRVELVGG